MSYTNSKAQNALGTTIAIGSTPTTIGEIKSIKLSGRKWDTDDVTNLQSPMKEFINAIADPGEFSIDGSRVSSDAGQIALEAAFASGALTDFTVQLPKTGAQTTGDKYTFKALVTECDYSFDSAKAMTFSARLKVSGAMTFTAGA